MHEVFSEPTTQGRAAKHSADRDARAWGGSSGAGLRAVHHEREHWLLWLLGWLHVDSRREGGGDEG